MSQTTDVDQFQQLWEITEPDVLKSHDPVLLWQLGQICRRREHWQDSERILLEAIKWGPSFPEPYRDLGLVYMRREDLPEEVSLANARDFLERCVRVEKLNNDPSAVTHTLLGSVLIWSDD